MYPQGDVVSPPVSGGGGGGGKAAKRGGQQRKERLETLRNKVLTDDSEVTSIIEMFFKTINF